MVCNHMVDMSEGYFMFKDDGYVYTGNITE